MGTKITNLPQVTTPKGTDEFPLSQDTGSGTRTTYKTTLDQISNYVKSAGGGTGTVTSVGVASPNGSLDVLGSPIVGSGTINLEVKSVELNKLANGGATNGQVLTYNGTTWAASATPSELPSTAINGQVLTYNGTTWVASNLPSGSSELPSTASNGQILLYNGAIWVASDAPKELPSTANNGQILSYNGAAWVANDFSPTSYTTVGNASAGIFCSAVCFIPSASGTGTWTAPPGCYSARVTLVGGGGIRYGAFTRYVGGDSHFNCPSSTTTSENQLFAGGGGTGTGKGRAAWNGYNDLVTLTTPTKALGQIAAGGCGGIGTAETTFGRDGSLTSGVAGSNANSPTGAGGIFGDGGPGASWSGTGTYPGGRGGGVPIFSYAAMKNNEFISVYKTVGDSENDGGAGGWCSAIVSVVPGQSYSYAVGAAARKVTSGIVTEGKPGMVMIEW